jgi:Ca2+-binding RTX toxin-like protein
MSRRIAITAAIVVALVIAATVTVYAVTRNNDVERNRIDHFSYNTSVERSRQVIYGTPGDDVIHGNKLQNGKPAQVIYAEAGNDRVWGGKGEDYVYGQKGDDRLHAYHASAGYIYGGPGYDRCTIAVFPGGLTKVHTESCEKIIEKPAQGHGNGA